MKLILNPDNGAPIKDFLFQKRLYSLGVGEKQLFEDEIADGLKETFGFLEEVIPEGKFVCRYGDYASDKQIAVIGHERGHKEEPKAPSTEFITPQEKRDFGKRSPNFDEEGIPIAATTDRDGVEWYGEGLQIDDEVTQKPGRFS